tara:strand:- start:376 stop:1020 length:645 start_codon:yes stop_codon:yes gene_type:complete
MSKIKHVDYTFMNWGPFVMKTKLPDYIVKRLLKEGDKLRKDDSYNHKLAGHLNHQFLYKPETQNWFYREIIPVLNAYRNGHCNYHGLENLPVEFSFDDLWVNYMKSGDFNPLHTHGGDYSFVLFIDVPKKLKKEQEQFEGTSTKPGMLAFEYTQQAKPRWATTGITVQPEPGDFFMFPALLQHWVAPFKSKITRVSVSGNMRIEQRDKLPHDYF